MLTIRYIVISAASLGVLLGTMLAATTSTSLKVHESSWRERFAAAPVTQPFSFAYSLPSNASPVVNYILPRVDRKEAAVQQMPVDYSAATQMAAEPSGQAAAESETSVAMTARIEEPDKVALPDVDEADNASGEPSLTVSMPESQKANADLH